MGFTRKVLSVHTLGLIDFQSDKERMARSARLTKRNAKKTTKAVKAQTAVMKKAAQSPAAPTYARPAPTAAPIAVPPGFMTDPDGSGRLRWWDGTAWTDTYH